MLDEVLYLDSLSVVGLHNMETEAVHAPSRCQEDAGLLVKVSSHIHQNLAGLGRARGAAYLRSENSKGWRGGNK